MPRIDLEKTLNAPIGACFDILADHEAYSRFRGISTARLAREGETDRNGLGAIRRLTSGRIWFEEEIVAFEPPRRLDYLIVGSNIPLTHDGGSIRLEERGGTTHVHWTSTFTMRGPLPAVSGPLVARALRKGFVRMLEDTERLAQTGSAGPATR